MLRKVVLHGTLAEEFCEEFELDADSIYLIVQGLGCYDPKLKQALRSGEWHFCLDEVAEAKSLGEDQVLWQLGNTEVIHIVPAVEGAKSGAFKIITGAALAIVGFAVPGMQWVGMLGVSFAAGGIAQMLAPTPHIGDMSGQERPEDRPSFMFNGAVNTGVQGLGHPLLYGRDRTGSVTVSAGLTVGDIAP